MHPVLVVPLFRKHGLFDRPGQPCLTDHVASQEVVANRFPLGLTCREPIADS
jgi:hypothetical protein